MTVYDLVEAKQHFKDNGMGNQSWLDGSIGIAESRARLKCDVCRGDAESGTERDKEGELWCASCDQAGAIPNC